jgi:hypothetical protein
MNYLFLWCFISVSMIQAGSLCHISNDELDPVATYTDVEPMSDESMQDFLDEFDFTITTSPVDDAIENDEKSLHTRLVFMLKKTAIFCLLKAHYARDWFTEKWNAFRS